MTQDQTTQSPKPSFLQTRGWLIALLIALGLLTWNHSTRITHIDHVSNLAGGDEIVIDASSPTGYEKGFRKLVVPEKNTESIQWIMQAQTMFEEDTFLLRHVDYDNAPDGRSVRTASAYRWYLASISWIHNLFSDSPIGISVERAALLAGPILQLLTLLLATAWIARYFGNLPASVFAIGFATLVPLATAFPPGQPNAESLLLACSLASLLLLSSGFVSSSSSRFHFFASGLFAGLALWTGPSGSLPLLIGTVLSATAITFFHKPHDSSHTYALPWRAWAIAVASVSFLAWLLDRSGTWFDATSWQSDFTHPLYSLALLSCGELLSLAAKRGEVSKKRIIVLSSLLLLPIGGLIYTFAFNSPIEGWSLQTISPRLTNLSIDPEASSLAELATLEGSKAMLLAATLMLGFLAFGVTHVFKTRALDPNNKLILLSTGPLLVIAVFGFSRLGWWSHFGVIALVFAAIVLGSKHIASVHRWGVAAILALCCMLGISLSYSGLNKETENSVEPKDFESLIERHLAQWLSIRGAEESEVALAPPNVSATLAYYGSLRGLGTPYPENVEGFSTAVRLSAASTPDEAHALSEGREIRFIVHPSWDPFLEEYARLGSEQPENSFIALLNRWLAPRWLDPVSFQLPGVPGFENEWVTIYRVVPVQDNASAIGRLVEYFLDTGRNQLALQAQQALASSFGDELVTHIVTAEIAMARGDANGLKVAANSIVESIEAGADFYLPWEFRVSASLALANAKLISQTRTQVEQCLSESTTENIQRLSTSSLTNFLYLAQILDIEFPDPEVKAYAVSLLPKQEQSRFNR